MTGGAHPRHKVRNQSIVSFQSGSSEHVAYSNTVVTPLVGPKLELSKRAKPECVSLDDIITYRLTLRNKGNRCAEATLYDELPEGAAFVPNSVLVNGVPLPGVNPGSGIPVGTVGAGESIQILFQVLVATIPPDLKLVNQAHADYVFHTLDGRAITGTVWSEPVAVRVEGARFSTHLSACTDYTFVCDNVAFTLTIANRGISRMERTTVALHIPSEGRLVPGSVTVDEVCMPLSDNGEEIAVGEIDPGCSVRISFHVRITEVPKRSFFDVNALVHCIIKGSAYEEKTNTVRVKVVSPKISLRKSASVKVATTGDTVRYKLLLRNDSDFAVDAVLKDCLPAGALFIWDSVEIDGKREKGKNPSEGIRLGALRAHSAVEVSFAITVPPTALDRKDPIWSNKARLDYIFRLPDGRKVGETVWSNTVDTELLAPYIRLSVDPALRSVEPGHRIAFTAVLRNRGNLAAEVTLARLYPAETEALPDGIRLDGLSGDEWLHGGMLPLGRVEPGGSVRIQYEAIVNKSTESPFIRWYAVARYAYKLNGKSYENEVRSNEYEIQIEHDYE